MTKRTLLVTWLVLLMATVVFAQSTVPVTVLHYNDFHARNLSYKRVYDGDTLMVGGYANLAGYINHYRETEPNAILLHAGDDFQGSPVSTISKGRSQVDILNIVKPDAFAVGNHEFDYTADTLIERMSHAEFPVLSANTIWEETGKRVFTPDTILTVGGVKIGVVGMIVEDLLRETTNAATKGIAIKNRDESIQESLDRLNPITDIQILLSHRGVWSDSSIAETFTDFELIVGGHSHTTLPEPKVVNGTPIVQAGSYGRYLGVVHFDVDTVANSVVSYDGQIIRTVKGVYPEDERIAEVVAKYESMAGEELDKPVATLTVDWLRQNGKESNIGQWIAEAYRAAAGADIGVTNQSGIRKDVMAGPLTMRDIMEVSPFSNTLVVITLTGAELKEIANLLASRTDGERYIITSGLTLYAKGGKVKKLLVNGKKVKAKREYKLATLNYVADHMEHYFNLDPETHPVYETGMLDRDAMLEAARNQGVISNEVVERYVVE